MFNNGKIFRESEEPIVGDKVWMWRESLRWVKCLSVTITSNSVVSLKLSQHLTEEDNRAVRTVRCGQIEAGLISFLLQISANFSVNFQKLAFAKNNLKFLMQPSVSDRGAAQTSILFSQFKLEIDLTQFCLGSWYSSWFMIDFCIVCLRVRQVRAGIGMVLPEAGRGCCCSLLFMFLLQPLHHYCIFQKEYLINDK